MQSLLRRKLGEAYKPRKMDTWEIAQEKIQNALDQIPRMMARSLEENIKFSSCKPWISFVFVANSAVGDLVKESLIKQFADENIGFKTFHEHSKEDMSLPCEGSWYCVNMEDMHKAHEKAKAEDYASYLKMCESR